MNKIISGLLAGVLLASSLPVLADRRDDRRDDHRDGRWVDRDVMRFQNHDLRIWRNGYWAHRRHGGQLGWWWIAGGIWYYYPSPVYPYPDPYTPPVTVINQPPVVVQPAQPQAPPPPQVWYYCNSAQGYYPYVPSCPEPWQQVPAQSPNQ